MSEVADFMENHKHIFQKAQEMRDRNETDADLIFYLLHLVKEKCNTIDELNNKLKKYWGK